MADDWEQYEIKEPDTPIAKGLGLHQHLSNISQALKYIASGQMGLDVAGKAGVGGVLPLQSDVVTEEDALGPIMKILNRKRDLGTI